MGPSVNIAIKDGKFTEAAIGFAKKNNVDVRDLVVKEMPKGKFVVAKKVLGGKDIKDVIPLVVPEILTKLSYGKTMVWETTGFKFPRPIRNLLVLYGDEVIKTTVADVKSKDITFGIKTLPFKKVKIKGRSGRDAAESYFSIMENECVIVSHSKRLSVMRKMLDNICQKKRLKYKEDKLLEEINMLIEYPSCVFCEFPREFLLLPEEVIINCMKTKQKFIPLFNEKGELSNNFVGIKNGFSEYLDNVKKGYEKVLIARLDDAKFFYETDLKTDFISRVDLLKGITYNMKLGSVYEKLQRIFSLVKYFNEKLNYNFEEEKLRKTLAVIKNDLTTLMVQEYPELQGIMGKIYCLSQKVEEDIACVCEEHYLPEDFEGNVPESNLSLLFSLASKLSDILDNTFIDNLPTGNSDPYGLKKIADGVIKICTIKKIDLSFEEILSRYILNFSKSDVGTMLSKIVSFFNQRVESIYTTKGFKIDEIRCVYGIFSGEFYSKKLWLEVIRQNRSSEEFYKLTEVYKRINNILRQGKKFFLHCNVEGEIKVELFKQEEENILFENLVNFEREIKNLYESKQFKKILEILVNKLKPIVDNFFDKVLVFTEDKELSQNRVKMLKLSLKLLNYVGKMELIQR